MPSPALLEARAHFERLRADREAAKQLSAFDYTDALSVVLRSRTPDWAEWRGQAAADPFWLPSPSQVVEVQRRQRARFERRRDEREADWQAFMRRLAA